MDGPPSTSTSYQSVDVLPKYLQFPHRVVYPICERDYGCSSVQSPAPAIEQEHKVTAAEYIQQLIYDSSKHVARCYCFKALI